MKFSESISGKYFFSDCFLWADGLLASLKMLQVMARLKKSLSAIRRSYPRYYQVKLAVKCAWENLPRRWVGKGEKRVFGDSFVFIRASGTEPLIRIFSDSPDKKKAEKLAKDGKKLVAEKLCEE